MRGISRLYKTWRKRMDEAYKKGNKKNPLRAKHKGSTAYTGKFEASHPGEIRKLFRYAQKVLSNQATYQDLAKVMNEKAKTKHSLPLTKFNSKNVWR